MYKPLVAAEKPPTPEPGWVYIGQDATGYYYQREGLEGLWGAIKKIGKGVGKVVGKVGGVAAAFIPGGSLIKSGIAAAIGVIRSGTEQQVAAVMAAQMTPEQRAALEREYLERRARELGGTVASNLPLLLGLGMAGLLLLNTRRRR